MLEWDNPPPSAYRESEDARRRLEQELLAARSKNIYYEEALRAVADGTDDALVARVCRCTLDGGAGVLSEADAAGRKRDIEHLGHRQHMGK